jgi:hypothetical protein
MIVIPGAHFFAVLQWSGQQRCPSSQSALDSQNGDFCPGTISPMQKERSFAIGHIMVASAPLNMEIATKAIRRLAENINLFIFIKS